MGRFKRMSMVMFLLALFTLAELASGASRGGGGMGGGARGSGGTGGGARGGGGPGGGARWGGHGHGHRSHGSHSHSHFRFGVGFGGVFAPWGWPHYGYAPYWSPYYYPGPSYVPPPYYVESPQYGPSAAVVYSNPQQHWWYYCRPSEAYYPYVASCPAEWERVQPYPPPAPENPPLSD
jgi:hypothetical protein